MAHEPFLAAPITPELRAAHVKDAPVGPPLDRLTAAVGLGKKREDLVFVTVHVLQPVLSCFLVMRAVDFPVRDERQIVLKVRKQIVRGHLPAGKEIAAHPIAGSTGNKMIRELAVGKNVDEKQST